MSWDRGTFRRSGTRCVVLPPSPDLHSQARGFAQLLNGLLNGTVTNGVRMRAVVVSTGQVDVGYALTKSMVVNRRPFPLAVDSRSPARFMGLSYTMTLDPEGQYLTAATSVCALYADAEGNDELFHYDYERNKRDGYPEDHLHAHAESTPLGAVMAKRGLNHHLRELHFPLGDRRYRLCLEDAIEFLIVERLVDARDGWQTVLTREREVFRRLQLRAAIRRDPENRPVCPKESWPSMISS